MVGVKTVVRKYPVFGISVLLVIIILISFFIRGKKQKFVEISKEGIYNLNGIFVDIKNKEIRFASKVRKNKGEVMYLLYLDGYKWLKEKSAIVSEAKLLYLQKAIAMIDWELWDDLWAKKINRRIDISIKYDGKEVEASQLLMCEKELNVLDFVFLGSPYFDSVALGAGPLDCAGCPLLPLEVKLIEELKGKTTVYSLNQQLMPKIGEKVEVIMRLTS